MHTSLKRARGRKRKKRRETASFEALSYAWGDATDQRTIHVNGRPFQVTHNLYVALMHLRKDNEDRCMWVDAICINQADDRECSSQVAQMQRIYRLAKSVVVFLGDTWAGCDTTMDMMIKGGQDQTLHYDPSREPHIVTHGMNTSSKELGAGVLEFFASPWWFRLWTVQEYCLAQNVVFQYGARTITNSLLVQWYINQRKHRMTCCQQFRQFLKPIDETVRGVTAMEHVRLLLALESYRHHRRGTSFVAVMTNFRVHQCLDPRDKIYGVLGLLTFEMRSLVQPDYTDSPRNIYCEVALASITSTKSLDILSCKYGTQTLSLNLPSFVPDWTAKVSLRCQQKIHNRMHFAQCHYKASKSSPVDLHSTDSYEVTISGVYVERIISIAEWLPWELMLSSWRKLANADENACAYVDRATAFWQAMCGGLHFKSPQDWSRLRPIEEHDISSFNLWKKLVDSDFRQEPVDEDARQFNIVFQTITAERRFVVTEKGYIGWAPRHDVKVGDCVVLLSGGKVPYILRPVDSDKAVAHGPDSRIADNSSKSKSWTFVGDAYIHGKMQGECWDEEKLENFRLV